MVMMDALISLGGAVLSLQNLINMYGNAQVAAVQTSKSGTSLSTAHEEDMHLVEMLLQGTDAQPVYNSK